MKKLVLLILASVIAFAEMTFVDPQPSFENPRKWVIKLRISDSETVNHMLGSIYNVLKEYPSESIKIAVVAYGKGMRVLRKDYDQHTLSRISSLMNYNVEFIACRNTMETMNWTEDEFIDELIYVQAGIAELIEKQVDGYYETSPY
jgi:intracellular sulfur oxidation DsrE/DsrF family protein